jgi:hypothetical protein
VPEELEARSAKTDMWVGEFVAPRDWHRGEDCDRTTNLA